MKVATLLSPILAGGMAVASAAPPNGHSVVFNGVKYTCTTRCVITTNPNGTYRIGDCCGGRHTFVINQTPPPQD
jgi:hypothetical protein